MKKIQIILLTGSVALTGCSQELARQEQNPPRNAVFVISPHLPDKSATVFPMIAWATRQPDCSEYFFDGDTAGQISGFSVPPRAKYFSESGVAQQIGEP